MKLKVFISFLVSYVVLTAYQTVDASPTNEAGLIPDNLTGTQSLKILGVVGDRMYFIDTGVAKTWKAAKVHCETANLKLASVETREQANFLISALAKYPFNTLFWTSLRESRQPTMMVWDDTGNQVDTSFLKQLYFHTPAYQYCTVLRIVNSQIQLFADSARGENLRHVLCHAHTGSLGKVRLEMLWQGRLENFVSVDEIYRK